MLTPSPHIRFDTWANTERIQYLDTPDFVKHLQLVCDRRDHLLSDCDYLSVFHQEAVQKLKGDGKKESRLVLGKMRVIGRGY